MSKKNRRNHSWPANRKAKFQPVSQPANTNRELGQESTCSLVTGISPAQLAANRANSQMSTGPRTEGGLARSSKNAVKSALTGRTVLLPGDDVEEYAAFLAEYENELKPVGQQEKELVQVIIDCRWRLRRIQELEYAIYTHGERQFAQTCSEEPAEIRGSMILLETHLAFQKELRNLHIQEARIDRKRSKALAELHELQAARTAAAESDADDLSNADSLAALDTSNVPKYIAPNRANQKTPAPDPNGFVFSNDDSASSARELSEAKAA